MTAHIAHREFTVSDGNAILCDGEVRYTFTVKPGRRAVTWANASGGFSPAEGPTVELTEVAVRTHPKHNFQPVTGVAFDLLSAEVGDDWFLAQIEEQAA